jgi:predicted ATP-binding protein involved in virulence
MRIDHLAIQNFRGFESFDLKLNPQFNLLVGNNGSGKTTILDALYIAAGSWLLGIDGPKKAPSIDEDEVRLTAFEYENGRYSFEKQYPVRIQAAGSVMDEPIDWAREKVSDHSTTRYGTAKAILDIGRRTVSSMRSGESIVLPLISAYGIERLTIEPDPPRNERAGAKLRNKERPSRLNGYRDIQFLINEEALFDWIETETLAGLQNGADSAAFKVVRNAIISCIEDATDLYYDVKRQNVVVVMNEHGAHPYELLSDGQRIMLTLVGDIARKAITLNPQLGARVLEQVPGIVTIDELDLHLDPKWQRRVIRDLRKTFPAIQFTAATHSPQLIGEAEPWEIIRLDDLQLSNPEQSFGMDSNWILKHVMDAGDRDEGFKRKFEEADRLICDLKFEAARELLNELRSSIHGDHPDLVRLSARIDRLSGAVK